MHIHPRSQGENFLNNLRPVPVVLKQQNVDRVGVEPTTSAHHYLSLGYCTCYLKAQQAKERQLLKPLPVHFFFLHVL